MHGYGGIVFHDVINLRHAEKAAAQGVDGIIAVCAGAGGHAGVLSPFALVKQIREVYPGTIILSGAMSTGADVLAAQALGRRSGLSRHALHRDARRPTRARSTSRCSSTATPRISSTPRCSAASPAITCAAASRAPGWTRTALPEADKAKMNFGTGGDAELKAWRDIWSAGQSVSGIHDVASVPAITDRMEREYQAARARLA